MENKSTHIMYGFITGLAMVVIGLILYVTGLSFRADMEYLSYLPFIPLVVGIILNGIAYSKSQDGFVTFGNVFGNCFKAAMIVALVMTGWSIISMFVFPEMKEKAINMAIEKMQKNKDAKLSDEQIDATMSMMKKYWNVFLIAGGLFTSLFWGAIISLIAAGIAKKKGPKPFTADSF